MYNGALQPGTYNPSEWPQVCQFTLANPTRTVLTICITINLGDTVQWVTSSAVTGSGFGVLSMDSAYNLTLAQYGQQIVPTSLQGQQLSTAGSEQIISYTFQDSGVFYFRDPTHNSMLGSVAVTTIST